MFIKIFPFGGLTQHPLLLQKGGWWRGIVIALSGTMIDVMLFPLAFGLSFLAIPLQGTPFVLVALAPAAIQGGMLFGNFFPRDMTVDGEQIPNDMKCAWQYLTGTYRKIIHDRIAQLKNAARDYAPTAEPPNSWGLFDDPTLSSQFLSSVIDCHHKLHQRARQKFQIILETGRLNPFERAYLLNILTTLELALGDDAAINNAAKWNEEARAIFPSSPPLQNTYGAVLVTQKAYDVGIEYLEAARPLLHKPDDLRVNSTCLAFAYEQLGNVERAEFWKEQLQTTKGETANASQKSQ